MTVGQHIDYDALNALKDIMEDDFTFLIETFLQDSHDRIATLRGLVDSLDSDAIRRASHSFKGSCSNLGALRLANLCAALERKSLESNFDTLTDDLAAIEEEFECIEKLIRDFLV